MSWMNAGRPGYFGKKREEFYKQYDERYGKDNWRIMWRWGRQGEIIIPYITACKIYEHAYFVDSLAREEFWQELRASAKNVYDHNESDIESGLDYLIQKGDATHVQDIAIRNVFAKRGWEFEGQELIQIRSHNAFWGKNLSPGKVQFHLPEFIINPHLCGWWENNTVEDFYQSNKIIQINNLALRARYVVDKNMKCF